MIEPLKKIIRSIILPKYPEIKSFYVWREGIGTLKTFYTVRYELSSDIGKKEYKLVNDTKTLFKMLGPHNPDAISVFIHNII